MLRWYTLWHFSRENLLLANQPLLANECRHAVKRSSTFLREKVHPVTWLEDFLTSKWPDSLIALHLMTCLTILVTWKWHGCLDFLAPPLGQCFRTSASLSILAALWKLRFGGPCRLQLRITINAIFTVRLHGMQRTVLRRPFCPSVCQTRAWQNERNWPLSSKNADFQSIITRSASANT